jgi:hypothetical protein
MAKSIKKLGGPKTAEGKQIVSKNAQKSAIFTKGYLPSEDVAQKQAQFDQLSEQWHAYDPTRQMILRTIEQTNLGLERMMASEKIIIEGAMQSLNIAHEFVERAGLTDARPSILPPWFFMEDDGGEKNRAILIDQIWGQAEHLRVKFRDAIVPQISQLYPELYAHVMQGQQPNASFLMVLGQQYKQSAVTLNLATLMNALSDKYPHHLMWARAPKRHQMIIDAIRQEQMREVMDLEKTNRYAVSFQNRIFKGIQMMATLDQHEAMVAQKLAGPTKDLGPIVDEEDPKE